MNVFSEPPGPFESLRPKELFNPEVLLKTELREFLAVPRKLPRPFREDIATVLAYELFFGKEYEIKDEKRFIESFGAFYPLFLSLRNFSFWNDFKELAGTNRMAGIYLLKALLREIFTLLGDYPEIEPELTKSLEKNLRQALDKLKELIEETLAVRDEICAKNSGNIAERAPEENKGSMKSRGPKEGSSEEKGSEERKNQPEGISDPFSDFSEKSPENFPLSCRNLDNKENPAPGKSSGKLASLTARFLADKKAGQVMDSIIEKRVVSELEGLLEKLEEQLEVLEILSLLFPAGGWDHSMQALHRDYFEHLVKYAGFFRKSSDLKAILEEVGRIELEYGSRTLALSPGSKSEVHAVTFSHEIQNLLPVEAVKLKHPLLKYKFYADMLEGKLLTYQLKGEDRADSGGRKKKGPVVALVDTSASMRGPPELLAKAVMLAVTKKMLKEGRDVKVVLFASKWQTLEIELTDKKRMGSEFLDFLAHTFGGGTDFNTALRAGVKALKAEGAFRGADLLFLTDGASELSEGPLIREWNEIKKERKARIFSLIIGNDSAGGFEQVSDHIFLIRNAEDWGIRESPARFVKLLGRPGYR